MSSMLNCWTLATLVGAFLDLGIAYLLLCCSALAFLASRFLALFGICLPCPCNGLFGYPNFNCFQSLLADASAGKIASVHAALRSRFPFDRICAEYDFKMIGGKPSRMASVLLVVEGEGSCNSQSLSFASSECASESSRYRVADCTNCRDPSDSKGKAVWSDKSLSDRGRRRRAPVPVDKDMDPIVSSSSNLLLLVAEMNDDRDEEGSETTDSEGNQFPSGGPNEVPSFSLDGKNDGYNHKVRDKDLSFIKELGHGACDGGLDGNETHRIEKLEQAILKEHAACTALYLELEKERNAASTAAEEAMAMISRLQEGKASIEMEARQYQRLTEEKFSYDEEEMVILKEIIVKRETEIHFLETELEACRQMMLHSERNMQPESVSHSVAKGLMTMPCPFDSTDHLLQQIKESTKNKAMKNAGNQFAEDINIQSGPDGGGNEVISLGSKDVALPKCDMCSMKLVEEEKCYHRIHEGTDRHPIEFQEKDMASMDKYSPVDQFKQRESKWQRTYCSLTERNSSSVQKQGPVDGIKIYLEAAKSVDRSQSEMGLASSKVVHNQNNYNEDLCQNRIGNLNSCSMAESSILDVHVIDDKSERPIVGSKEKEMILVDTSSKAMGNDVFSSGSSAIRMNNTVDDQFSFSSTEDETYISRIKSLSGLRHNSISSVDNERLKLEIEVGQLRERLKIVQEGREKFSFTMDHKEREKFQLLILDEMESQLQEIRSLTHLGVATRQTSLPPPSSKVKPRKRHCQSVSGGLKDSN